MMLCSIQKYFKMCCSRKCLCKITKTPQTRQKWEPVTRLIENEASELDLCLT